FVETPGTSIGGGDTFPRSAIDGKIQKFKGALPDVLTNNAMAFMKANKDKPFALLLHYQVPHDPYLPLPEQDVAHYRDLDPTVPEFYGADVKSFKQTTKEYYSAISAADRNVGQVLDFLDENKLSENTLVLFTSDNGENIGQHRIHGKGNGRWIAGGIEGAPQIPNMWDTSIRVPLVMRWPGVIKKGIRSEHMISNL
ncbi:unnamed protein product, partial [marine sediment metagenome]